MSTLLEPIITPPKGSSHESLFPYLLSPLGICPTFMSLLVFHFFSVLSSCSISFLFLDLIFCFGDLSFLHPQSSKTGILLDYIFPLSTCPLSKLAFQVFLRMDIKIISLNSVILVHPCCSHDDAHWAFGQLKTLKNLQVGWPGNLSSKSAYFSKGKGGTLLTINLRLWV